MDTHPERTHPEPTLRKKKSQTRLANDEFRALLGARVSLRRAQLGMSQEALAEQIDRKQAEISRLESGGYSLGAQWYPVIAEVLGVDVGWLMGSGPDDPDVLRERDRLRDERLVRVAPPERTVRTKKERTRPAHGLSTKPEYLALVNARHRCNTPSNKDFARYGGRGVEYRFPADFGEAYRLLIEAIGPRPDGKTLDRIDNDGHYEPGNVRWSTRSEQQRNQHRNSSNGRAH